jgi:hypothetical protein
MSHSVFCPVCHHRNEEDQEVCSFCGAQIKGGQVAIGDTTENISNLDPNLTTVIMPSEDYLEGVLPDEALALYMMDEQEPIIIEGTKDVVLGRKLEDVGEGAIDLTWYGALELGVSRRHAKISCVNGVFLLEDLGSTNGTWLNQRRLTPGVPYRLHNHDTIILGRLRMTVFLHSNEKKSSVSFSLVDSSFSGNLYAQGLTPKVLGEIVNPYLQAVVKLQHVSDETRNLPSRDVKILAINSNESATKYQVNLNGASEAVQLVHKWVVPWKHKRVSEIGNSKEKIVPSGELINLADLMLTDICPVLSPEERVQYIEKLISPLGVLASSPLEIDK